MSMLRKNNIFYFFGFPRRTYIIMSLLCGIRLWGQTNWRHWMYLHYYKYHIPPTNYIKEWCVRLILNYSLLYNLILKGHKGKDSYNISKTQPDFSAFVVLNSVPQSKSKSILTGNVIHSFKGITVHQCQRNCFIFFLYSILIKYSV